MTNLPRVLVIDDDPLVRHLIAKTLDGHYAVNVVGEGTHGFYEALESPPQVAIIDMDMPGWDGLKTLRAFRGHPSLNDVRILVMPSNADREVIGALLEQGGDDYLIKSSLTRHKVRHMVDRLVAEQRTANQV